MRLLQAQSKRLREFSNDKPEYAILSHTWGSSEISYKDIQESWFAHKWKPSWPKIEGSCNQALKDGLEYIWIDTCCIDKSSSAELQESINSMFRWYESANHCYAYLSDVPPGDVPSHPDSAFRKSRWFRRGWTLQELLAPTSVRFFDCEWNPIGDKYQLRSVIAEITGIGKEFLGTSPYEVLNAMSRASVAQKMSWAANRSTTRVEDRAYCLLGIFGINMPLLYGEGDGAFFRLQEEIMKTSHDQSILAGGYKRSALNLWGFTQALANSPDEFAECSDIVSFGERDLEDSFHMDQRGLRLYLPTFHTSDDDSLDVVYCVLNCGKVTSPGQLHLAIPLFRISRQWSPLESYGRISYNETQRQWTKWEFFGLTMRIPTWIHPNNIEGTEREKICLPRSVNHPEPSQLRVSLNLKVFENQSEYQIAGVFPPEIGPNNILHIPTNVGDYRHHGRIIIHFIKKGSRGVLVVLKYLSDTQEMPSTRSSLPSSNVSNTSVNEQEMAPSSEGRNNFRALIRECIMQTHDLTEQEFSQAVAEGRILLELGGDSLASISLMYALRKKTGVSIPLKLITSKKTIPELEESIEDLLSSSPSVDIETTSYMLRPDQLRIVPQNVEVGILQVSETMSMLRSGTEWASNSLDSISYRDATSDCRFELEGGDVVLVSFAKEEKTSKLAVSIEKNAGYS